MVSLRLIEAVELDWAETWLIDVEAVEFKRERLSYLLLVEVASKHRESGICVLVPIRRPGASSPIPLRLCAERRCSPENDASV